MIVSTPSALETVDNQSFRDFFTTLDPSLEIPTTSVIRSQLLKTYSEKKQALKSILSNADDMSLTCESWSYRAEDSFLTVSCHFVDNLGNLKSYMLSTVCLFGDESADNIKSHLKAIMEAWGVKEKVHSVVRASLPQLKRVPVNWMVMPCFADTLNVVFKALMSEEDLDGVFRKCQNIVKFFELDPEAEGKLRDIAEEELNLYCGDRWLLWLDMLEGVMKQREAMVVVFAQKKKIDLILNEDETVKVQNIISALIPLKRATAMMKTEGFQSISVVLPVLMKLMEGPREEERKGNVVAKKLRSICKEEFGDISKHAMAVFTFLDPRYKDKLGEQN
ncbi:zinc finger BED domain-containing protein 1 [Xyrichtys novacula]|uniref:Zinc finger BED domain-containing protein 1 n=1 Tax=Xyrichtys novacula TaxID=13765 RepID=A0AAV1FF26_XYRNO|nr:zinc finger BED domain-containing protein 1 [Xyrichtys novacula]